MIRCNFALYNKKKVNISEVTPDKQCYCIECGEPLIQHHGLQRAHYFRHHPNGNVNCVGWKRSSQESEVHKIAKELFKTRFDELLKNQGLTLSGYELKISKKESYICNKNIHFGFWNTACWIERSLVVDKDTKIRPDIEIIENGRFELLIEIYYTNNKNSRSREKYKKYIKHNPNSYLIEIDLHDLVTFMNNKKYTTDYKESFEDIVFNALQQKVRWNLLLSKEIIEASEVLESSKLKQSGEYSVCPLQNDCKVPKNNCIRHCSLYLGTECGQRVCGANRGIGDAHSMKLALNGYDSNEIKDLVKELGEIEKVDNTNYMGECPVCKKKGDSSVYSLVQGCHNNVRRMSRVPEVPIYDSKKDDYIKTEFAYLHCCCGSAGEYKAIRCPECGRQMKLLVNSNNGRVFLCCENHDLPTEDETKRHYGSVCNPKVKGSASTITVFEDVNCEVFADEIKAIGGFGVLLDNKYNETKHTTKPHKNLKEIRKALSKVRRKKKVK